MCFQLINVHKLYKLKLQHKYLQITQVAVYCSDWFHKLIKGPRCMKIIGHVFQEILMVVFNHLLIACWYRDIQHVITVQGYNFFRILESL